MNPRIAHMVSALLLAVLLSSTATHASAARTGFPEDDVAFEVVGQVKNSPPGQPPTSNQYGYVSYINGFGFDALFAAGGPQNETTALLTFFNDSTTLRVISHGSERIINREGTMTVYYDDTPDGDLTTPNPDSFRDGTPILVMSWRHQAILDTTTGLFSVTFVNTVTEVGAFGLNGDQVRLARVGDKFRISLFGVPDPTGLVNGKFAGTAVALARR